MLAFVLRVWKTSTMAERYIPEKTVYVDMDNVIAGFDEEIISRMKSRYAAFKGDRSRDNFYIADDYPEHSSEIKEVYVEAGFFKSLPVLEGALEGWQRMIDRGWQPRVLSSPLSAHPACEIEKRHWLTEHFDGVFGNHVSEDAVITKNKHLYNGIALLDDRGVVPNTALATWSHVVMHYPHNEAVDTDLRLHGMTDARLEEVLEITHERYVRSLGSRAL